MRVWGESCVVMLVAINSSQKIDYYCSEQSDYDQKFVQSSQFSKSLYFSVQIIEHHKNENP